MDLSACTSLKTAIVVCGHAVYHGGQHLPPTKAVLNDNWHLQPFQKNEPPHYIAHVRAGVTLAAEHPDSLLIFSGGQTRYPHILSEAQGYHHIATIFDFWGHKSVPVRTTTEEFAADSFDNVLFGIARFREAVGCLPQHLIVVSWRFKENRFDNHAASIRWPRERWRFEGVGEPDDLEVVQKAEAETLNQFREDPTGHGAKLGAKKRARNPYRRQHGYELSCPEMATVLTWNGESELQAIRRPRGTELKMYRSGLCATPALDDIHITSAEALLRRRFDKE